MPKLPEPVINVSPNFTPQREIAASDLSQRDDSMAEGLTAASRAAMQGAGVLAEKKQKDDAFQVQRDMSKLRLDWIKHFQKRQEEAEPGAPGFTDSLMGELDTAMNDMADNSNLSQGALRDLRTKQDDFRLYMTGQAIAFESTARGAQKKRDVEATIDNMSQIVGADPSTLGANVGDLDEMLDSLQVDANAREELRTYGRKTLSIAAAMADIQKDPQKARDTLRAATGAGDVKTNYLTSLQAQENPTGDPNASPGTSSALGKYQFTEGTWDGLRRRYPGLGLTADGRTDSAQQDRAIQVFTAENAETLRKSGFASDPKNLYMAHFLGGDGAVKFLAVLNANPNAPAATVVGSAAAGANKSVFYEGDRQRTVTEVFDKQTAKFSNEAMKTEPGKTGNPAYDALSAATRLQLLSNAETELTQRQSVARAELEPRLADAQQAFLTNGAYTGAPITRADFQASYEPARAEMEYQKFVAVQQVGTQTQRIKTMTIPEMDALIVSEKPKGSGVGFDREQAKYESLQQAVSNAKKQRNEDPVRYVQAVFPEIQTAWDEAKTPEQIAGAISQTMTAQEKIGIPPAARTVLPKDTVTSAVAQFQNEEASLDDRITAVSNYVFATPDTMQRQQILGQMFDAGVPPKLEAAFDALARGDEGAADRLFQAGMVKPGDLPGKLKYTDDSIADEIQSGIMDEGKIGDAVYGLGAGVVGNEMRAARDQDLIVSATKYRIARGQDLDEAVTGAARDVYGPIKAFEGSGAIVALPEDTDEQIAGLGFDAVREHFRISLEQFIPTAPAGATPADLEINRLMTADVNRRIEDIIDTGQIRNVDGGFGLFDTVTGMFVAGFDGKPATITLETVMKAGEAAKQRPDAMFEQNQFGGQ